jgi:hypothetical protein
MAGHVAVALFFQQAQELFTTRSLMQTDGGWMVTCNRDMEVVSNAQKVFHFVHESPILHSQWTASSSVIGTDAQQQNSSWVMRFHFVHLRRRRPARKQNCSGCLCVTPASQTSRNGNILLRKQFGKGERNRRRRYLAFGIEGREIHAHGSGIGDVRLHFAGIGENYAVGCDAEIEHLRDLGLARAIKARTESRQCGKQRSVRAALHGVEGPHSWHRLHPSLKQSNQQPQV